MDIRFRRKNADALLAFVSPSKDRTDQFKDLEGFISFFARGHSMHQKHHALPAF